MSCTGILIPCIVCFVLTIGSTHSEEYDRLPDYETNKKSGRFFSKFSDVETLFLYKETEEFLNSFQDDEHREIIRQQLYYCPHVSLCRFSFNLYIGRSDPPRCRKCSCDNRCKRRGDCCPDILDYAEWKGQNQNEPMPASTCLSKFVKQSARPTDGYQLVYKCTGTDIESRQFCDINHSLSGKTLADVTPVIDTETNISYVNKDCAICNDIRPDALTMWKTELKCVRDKTDKVAVGHNFYIYGNPVDYVRSEAGCNIMYNPVGFKAFPCQAFYISICNITGKWKVFDVFLLRACLFFQSLHQTSKCTKETIFYRNIFCALCNGFYPESTILSFRLCGDGDGIIYSFTGLLGFAKEQSQSVVARDCKTDQFFNPLQNKCESLHCPPGRTLTNDECKLLNKDAFDTVYTDTVLVVPEEELPVDDALIVSVQENFYKWYSGILGLVKYMMQPYPSLYSMSICNATYRYRINQTCSKHDGVCDTPDILEYFTVVFQIQVNGWHNAHAIEKVLSEMKTTRFEMIQFLDEVRYKRLSFRLEQFNLQVDLLSEKSWQSVENNTEFISAPCNESFPVIMIGQQKPCPLVSLSTGEYAWYENEFKLFVSGLDMKVHASHFYLTTDLSNVYVCYDKFIKHSYFILEQISSTKFTPEHILCLACISLSLTCQLVSLSIYIILPELRYHLAGQNNLILISSLTAAQILYLIGKYGGLEKESAICKIIGIFTHFLWLVNIFWMSVCTLHVSRRITTLFQSSPRGNRYKFRICMCSTISFAAMFVVTNILVSLLKSDFNQIGYGTVSCSITATMMVGFTLILPIGLVIVTNGTLFLKVIWTLKKVSDLGDDTKTQQRDMLILAKLSILTGFTWMFLFISAWSGQDEFSNMFIVFSAFQGFYLCLSFVYDKCDFSQLKHRFDIGRLKTLLTQQGSS